MSEYDNIPEPEDYKQPVKSDNEYSNIPEPGDYNDGKIKVIEEDNDWIGEFLGSTGGGMGLAFAGAKGGAALGTVIFPGIGTTVGGAIGAIGGGILGSALGGAGGQAVEDLVEGDTFDPEKVKEAGYDSAIAGALGIGVAGLATKGFSIGAKIVMTKFLSDKASKNAFKRVHESLGADDAEDLVESLYRGLDLKQLAKKFPEIRRSDLKAMKDAYDNPMAAAVGQQTLQDWAEKEAARNAGESILPKIEGAYAGIGTAVGQTGKAASKDSTEITEKDVDWDTGANDGGMITSGPPTDGTWWSPQDQLGPNFLKYKAAIMRGPRGTPQEVIIQKNDGGVVSQMWYHDGKKIQRHFADNPAFDGYYDNSQKRKLYNDGDLVLPSERELPASQILMGDPRWSALQDLSGGAKGVFQGLEDLVELPGAAYGGIRRGVDALLGKDSYEGRYGYDVDLTPEFIDKHNEKSKAKAVEILTEHYGDPERAQQEVDRLWSNSEFVGSLVDPTILATGGASVAAKVASKGGKAVKSLDDVRDTVKVTDDFADDLDELEEIRINPNDPTEAQAIQQAQESGSPVSFCRPTAANSGGLVMSYNDGTGKCGAGYQAVTAHPDGRVSRAKTHRFTLQQKDGRISEHDMTNAQVAQMLFDLDYFDDLKKAKEYVKTATKSGRSGTMRFEDGMILQKQLPGQNDPSVRLRGNQKAAADVLDETQAEGFYLDYDDFDSSVESLSDYQARKKAENLKIPENMDMQSYVSSLRSGTYGDGTGQFMRKSTYDRAIRYAEQFDDANKYDLDATTFLERIDEYLFDVNKADFDLSDEAVIKALQEGREVVAYDMTDGGVSMRKILKRNDVKPKEYADPKEVSFKRFKGGPFKSTMSKFNITKATDEQIAKYQKGLENIGIVSYYGSVTKPEVIEFARKKRQLLRNIFGKDNDLYEDPANAWSTYRSKDKKTGGYIRKTVLHDPIQDGPAKAGRPKVGTRKHAMQQNKDLYESYLLAKDRIRNYYDKLRNLGALNMRQSEMIDQDLLDAYDEIHTELFGHTDDYMLDYLHKRSDTGTGRARDAEKIAKREKKAGEFVLYDLRSMMPDFDTKDPAVKIALFRKRLEQKDYQDVGVPENVTDEYIQSVVGKNRKKRVASKSLGTFDIEDMDQFVNPAVRDGMLESYKAGTSKFSDRTIRNLLINELREKLPNFDELPAEGQEKAIEQLRKDHGLNDGGPVKQTELHPGARVDTIPGKIRAGSYVVNAPAAQQFQKELDALGATWVTEQPFNDGGEVDVLLTTGEAVLSPEQVSLVGMDKLQAINGSGRVINRHFKGLDGNPTTMDAGQKVFPSDHKL